ncbi:hypothetical protein EDD37DRAFT_645943 [Exophiala viscosa]|uniref:uncharacterized protein n=1 Tax=Exophiala viscosa TaxID=2486360 RepID=UPI002193EE37|nr:hypothetical protein EDD37DRAFT_645943 [Exophiala viscosa]
MERADDSAIIDLEHENRSVSSDGSATVVQAGEVSENPKFAREKEGRRIRSSDDLEDRYLRQRAAAPKQNIFNPSTHSHAEQFLEMMKRYQYSTKDSKARPLDLGGTHSWDEVMRLVKDAEATYLEAGQSRLRQVGRLIGAQSESMVPFLRLIPNGFYTSIICGGLKLIFEAASNINKGREKVLDTLLQIPRIIVQAEHSVETFYPDPALYEKAEELYLAILGAIEGAAEWLKQHPVGKQARALARGQLYNKHFKEKVQALDEALVALQERASVLRDNAIVTGQKTAENVQTIVNKVAVVTTHTDVQLTSVTEDIKTFNVKMEDVHAAQRTTHVKIDDLHGVQQAVHSKVKTLSDVQQAKEQAARAMELALKTAEWREKDGRDIRRLKRQIKSLQKAASGLTQADMFDILNVNAETRIEDFRHIHRACQSLDPSDSQIAQGIIEGARFKQWLSADESGALFIEGGPALTFHGRFASLSLMSCLVIECLEGKAPAISIHHFCRRHTSSKDSLQGPQGMMRSLICQVLRLFDDQVDLSFAFSRRHREQLESHSLQMLCDCFANVVKQLPADTVLFCIIDSIDCFEKHEWAEDCRLMIRELQDILHEYEYGPVFKLLVTCPVRSRYVGGTFTSQCRLSLSGDGSAGRNDPTEREMSMGTRRPRARESDAFRSLRNMIPAGMEESSEDLSDSDFSWDTGPE